jgi:hypothetical protein
MTALPFPYAEGSGALLMAQIQGEKLEKSIGEKAEIFFLIFDEQENLIDLKRKAVETAALKRKEAFYYSLVPIYPASYKFRIVIRDIENGNGAVGRAYTNIPDFSAEALKLYPPLLLAPGKSGIYIRGHIPKSTNNKSKFPLLDYFPFAPDQATPLLGAVAGDAAQIQAVFRCSMRSLAQPRLKFTAALIEKTSKKSTSLPVSILNGKKDGDMGTLWAEFKLPQMPPGEYLLVITANDLTSQTRSETTTNLTIY